MFSGFFLKGVTEIGRTPANKQQSEHKGQNCIQSFPGSVALMSWLKRWSRANTTGYVSQLEPPPPPPHPPPQPQTQHPVVLHPVAPGLGGPRSLSVLTIQSGSDLHLACQVTVINQLVGQKANITVSPAWIWKPLVKPEATTATLCISQRLRELASFPSSLMTFQRF